jgi:hypothetical protein
MIHTIIITIIYIYLNIIVIQSKKLLFNSFSLIIRRHIG